MARESNRERIIEAGLRVMFRQGYNGSSVRDIVAAAGAPQGSFTNHFRSKEAFAKDVLDFYFEHLKRLIAQALEDETLSHRQRLRRYLDIITGRLEADGFERGCLIGDLSLEAAPQSELLRNRLQEIFAEWQAAFTDCIDKAQDAGEIATAFPSDDLAKFLIASWQGAMLSMKVERSAAPLERFKTIAFETVFKECPQ